LKIIPHADQIGRVPFLNADDPASILCSLHLHPPNNPGGFVYKTRWFRSSTCWERKQELSEKTSSKKIIHL